MSFAIAERKYAKAEAEFTAELLKEVERLARGVIQTCEKAQSFCMAMGSASFHCVWTETDELDPTDSWECEDNLEPDELQYGNSYAVELASLLDKYNDGFKLTGSPMKIIRDNVTGELVTLTDW